MVKRYINKKHLKYVSDLPCSIATHFRYRVDGGSQETYSVPTPCKNLVQAHHLLKPINSTRGVGRKASDKDVIPLCIYHHNMLHRMGNEFKFFTEVTNNKYFGQILAQQLWLSSPHYEEKEI